MRNTRTIVVALLALLATCVFGQMSWLANAGLFENPHPTEFQQHAGLWTFLCWVLPAIIVGVFLSRHVALVALAVNFIGAVVGLAWGDHGLVPEGSYLPDPPILLLYLVEEIAIGLVLAVLLAIGVNFAKRKIISTAGPRHESEET
jgi:flagellar biosynthesis protein FliR